MPELQCSIKYFLNHIQSVPVLKMNGLHRDALEFPVDGQLAALNEVMTQLDKVLAESEEEEEEEEEEVRAKAAAKSGGGGGGGGSGNINQRLSYVEHSYQQLTNDTYSADSLGHTQNTTDLNMWVS